MQLTDTDRSEEAEVKNMGVLPERQGRGVGRALLEAALELARGEGRSTLVVATAVRSVRPHGVASAFTRTITSRRPYPPAPTAAMTCARA